MGSLIRHIFINLYRISSYSFRGNYSFLNLEIQRSHYIRPKVIVHKGEETIQRRKPYEEIRYVNWKCFEKYSYVLALLQFLGFQTKRSSNWLSILENNFKSMNRMFESADQKKTQKIITNIVIEISTFRLTFTHQLTKVSKLSCLVASLVLHKEGFEWIQME